MKTILLIVSMLGLLSFTANGPDNKEISSLLSNKQTRQEIFQAIQGNPQFLADFMQEMHGNLQAGNTQQNRMADREYMLSMMHSNPEWMRTMIDNMFSVCATDSAMSRDLVNTMHQYNGMMNMMNGNMYHNGMMSGYNHSMMHYYNDR